MFMNIVSRVGFGRRVVKETGMGKERVPTPFNFSKD